MNLKFVIKRNVARGQARDRSPHGCLRLNHVGVSAPAGRIDKLIISD